MTAEQKSTDTAAHPVQLVLKAEAKTDAHLRHFVLSPNEPLARRQALEQAVAEIEAAVQGRTNHLAQKETKHALEAIHELDDCLRRNEWTQAGWDADAIGLWRAHVGARNVAHHQSSSVLVALHSDPPWDEQLRWAITAGAVNKLKRPGQAKEYNARLDGQPVLPPLRKLLLQISESVT